MSHDPRDAQIAKLKSEVIALQDAVVGAAVLWFGQTCSDSERDAMSEGLYESAVDIVKNNPVRLRGAFPREGF